MPSRELGGLETQEAREGGVEIMGEQKREDGKAVGNSRADSLDMGVKTSDWHSSQQSIQAHCK